MGRWTIHMGDNLDILGAGQVAPSSATLVYLDPPFFTQRDFGAFDDRWESLGDYLEQLRARALVLRTLLVPEGWLVVHVDPTASHYVKVMLDEVMGRDHFVNEVVWRYRRWPSPQSAFQRMHDVLLVYRRDVSVGVKPRWTQLFEPLAASTIAAYGTGKQFAVRDPGKNRIKTNVSTEEASPGAAQSDVWEIGIVAPTSDERTGYPTQKPIALLDRVVLALTSPGDLVVDPYMGSGTTGVSALRHARSFVGIDKSPQAVEIATGRLLALGSLFDRAEART